MIIHNKFWRILANAAGAWLLLNFTMLAVQMYYLVDPLLAFDWYEISRKLEFLFYLLCGWGMFVGPSIFIPEYLPLILLMLAFAIGFWIKERSWLSAGLLIIAGTAAGWTRLYFFGFPFAAICGSCIMLFVIWCVHFLPVFGHAWDTHIFTKSFWTWGFKRFAVLSVWGICIASWLLFFEYYYFPSGGSVLPYTCTNFKYTGHNASMAITIDARNKSNVYVVKTCLSALNYLKEKYGYDFITVQVFQEPNEVGTDLPKIGVCQYNWRGEYRNGNELEEWQYRAFYFVKSEQAFKMVPEHRIPQPAGEPPANPEVLPHIPTEEEVLAEGIKVAREFELLRNKPD